jgi:hypothetical protein
VHLQEVDDGTVSSVCAFSALAWRTRPAPLPAADGTPPQGGGLNAGLGGRLFYDDAKANVYVDLAAGRAQPIVDSDAGGDPFGSFDGSEIALWMSSYSSGSADTNRIDVLRLDGSLVAALDKPGYFWGTPKLSPDGQRLVVSWSDDIAVFDAVTVFGLDGSVVARIPGYTDWDWLPDGRLALARNNQIFVTDSTLAHPTPIGNALPDAVSGIAASPSGSRIAFAMDGHIWVEGIDGSGLKQLTASSATEISPAWSPDERYVAVEYENICAAAYAVPADGERVFVGNPEVPSSAVPLRTIDNGNESDICTFSALSWR